MYIATIFTPNISISFLQCSIFNEKIHQFSFTIITF